MILTRVSHSQLIAHRGHSYPCGAGLGASFDVELLTEVALQMTREAKAKKIHVMLGPTVNIARSPLCGSGFEFMGGEDPYLAGTLAAAFVDTAQTHGISACLNHFVSEISECGVYCAESHP